MSASDAEHLANHIVRTVTGPMWHGSALAELLAGVSAEDASTRPIAAAHTMFEIVLHAAAWAEIAHARLHGKRIDDPAPHEDWPPAATGDAAWRDAVKRLRDSYEALAAAVRGLDEPALRRRIPGLEYSVWTLLHGVIEHGTYHGGQLALLKRALSRG